MPTRRRTTPLLTVLLAVLLSGCGGAEAGKPSKGNRYGLIETGTINAATQAGQPPFAYADKSGKPVGFIIDVTDEAAKRLGLRVRYKATSVTSSLAGLTAGQYDLAASGLGVTAERQKSVDFTKPLFWSTTAVLTTKANKTSALTGFAGKKVGVVTGSAQEPFIPAKMPGAGAVHFQTENAAVSQLLSGNIDAFVVGGPDAVQFMKQYADLRIAASAPVDHPTSMAVPKKHAALLTALDEQITAMVSDGTYTRLYRRYFATPPAPQLLAAWPDLAGQFHGAS
jgi:polar amino acid transport system substrate-binding protein